MPLEGFSQEDRSSDLSEGKVKMPRQTGSGNHEGLGKKYVDAISRGKKLIWNKKQDVRMDTFMDIIREKHGVTIETYNDLHKWSVENPGKFWEEIFNYFEIIHSEPYEEVLPSYKEIYGIEWFRGLKFNYAENMLRYRDDRTALICVAEEGREKYITFAELYEEVKKYAAALRRHGLKIGDTVACYLPNREEAVFAMLACASIGALFEGIGPYYGHKAVEAVLRNYTPNFLFVGDKFYNDLVEYNLLGNLEKAVKEVTSIAKIIIVPSTDETLKRDISGIPRSCFLNDFLEPGSQHANELSTELKFEQLPFNHPLFIHFSSGTTGVPKAVVHPAGGLLALMRDQALHYNSSRDDVLFNFLPCGWTIWDTLTSALSLGSAVLCYSGQPYCVPNTSFWDICAKHKVTIAVTGTIAIDQMEKLNYVPDPSCDLSKLRFIAPAGNVLKLNNFEFLHEKVKKDMFVGSMYGQTELLGLMSGFHLNSPAYSGEIQRVALGTDLKVFDESGKPVVGQLGEVVICSPNPNFPLYLLNDESGEKLRSKYFSKFPGVWAVHDEGWINPETNALVIVGRSDEILNAYGDPYTPEVIYSVVQRVNGILDSACVRQFSRHTQGCERAILFLKLSTNVEFTQDLVQRISKKIQEEFTKYYVPEVILQTEEIPRNFSGKKMERLLSKIIETNQIPEENYCRNEKCLQFYLDIPELQDY